MNDIELTLLTEDNIWYNPLDFIKKYGKPAAVTDLAIARGANIVGSDTVPDDKYLSGRIGNIWTSSVDKETSSIMLINGYRATKTYGSYFDRYPAIRPVLNSPLLFNALYHSRTSGFNHTYEVVYGEYPQTAVSEKMQKILGEEYLRGNMNTTRKIYNFDIYNYRDYKLSFHPEHYPEYIYNNKKYICVKIKSYKNNIVKLSNGVLYPYNNLVWIKVEPITWFVDNENKLLISKKGLLSGIRYNCEISDNFKNTELYNYMNTYMIKEMFNYSDSLLTNNNLPTNSVPSIEKPREYPHINERMQEIKKRVRKLQERR